MVLLYYLHVHCIQQLIVKREMSDYRMEQTAPMVVWRFARVEYGVHFVVIDGTLVMHVSCASNLDLNLTYYINFYTTCASLMYALGQHNRIRGGELLHALNFYL